MKILHTVQFYDPSCGGMQEVVKQISENLVKRGHQVTVATSRDPARKSCSINGVTIREFEISGNMVTGIKGEAETYRDFVLKSDFDVITSFAAQQWATDLVLPLMHEIHAKKVFVPTGFSALYDPRYADYFEKMKGWMNQYDVNVFLSATYQDYTFARNVGIKNMTLIPNGASAEEFLSTEILDIRRELKIPADNFLVLHVGSHTGLKGHSEAIKIFSRAHINHVSFIIVGNVFSRYCNWSCKLKELVFRLNPKNWTNARQLMVCSLSRKQTVALYKSADIFLFPSKVECSPIVLFECMASKTPFLTSDVGNAREIVEISRGGVILPTIINSCGYSDVDIKKSVKMLEILYADKKRRILMADAGYRAWKENFCWERIAEMYERVYFNLVNGDM
jgi:Glycosyltransferase